MPHSYKLLADSQINPDAKAGTTVYDCHGHDYGCANDDTRITGIVHRSVTLDPTGDYPFFTVPERDLESLS
jgi:hypothetical protein